MDILVEFTGEVGARIIKDPRIIAEKAGQDNVLLNPDTKHLQGISPSFWVKNGDLIEAITPEGAHKIVFESTVPGVLPSPQKIITFEEKLREVKKEIDAKRDLDVHNLLRAMKHDRNEVRGELQELEDKLVMMQLDHEAWVKKEHRKVFWLSFLYLIAMILVKFS